MESKMLVILALIVTAAFSIWYGSYVFSSTKEVVQIVKVKQTERSVEQEIVFQSQLAGVDAQTALDIARAESHFKPLAVNHNTNGSDDKGVFQINSIHGVPDSCRLDYVCNIKWAMDEMKENGTRAWYSSQHKWE